MNGPLVVCKISKLWGMDNEAKSKAKLKSGNDILTRRDGKKAYPDSKFRCLI